jgi:hypothetical protein
MRTKLDSYAYYNHWFDTSVDGLLVCDGIIRPVVSITTSEVILE